MGVTVQIKIPPKIAAALSENARALLGVVASESCNEAAAAAVEIIRPKVPVKTGATADKLSIEQRATLGNLTARVGFNGDQVALYLEKGTRPHVIVARNAKALRWQEGGVARFARSVNHPGTKAHNMIGSSLPAVAAQLEAAGRKRLDDMIAGLA